MFGEVEKGKKMTESLLYSAAELAAVRPDDTVFVAELCADLSMLGHHLATVMPSVASSAPLTVVLEDEPRNS